MLEKPNFNKLNKISDIDYMKIISILLCVLLIGCMTTEERRIANEYYNSKEYRESWKKRECQSLRERIARGTDKSLGESLNDLFDAFNSPSNAYDIPVSTMKEQQEREKFKARLSQYKIAVESYKTLCR